MGSKYKYVLLNNNAILIGSVELDGDSCIIQDPYLIQNNGTEVLLIPFLEATLKQKMKTFKTHERNILSIIDAEKNDILDTYLSSITNIELPKKEIII